MSMTGKIALLALACLLCVPHGSMAALGEEQFVQNVAQTGSFPIVQGTDAAMLYVDSNDWTGVVRAAGDLQADINRVTGQTPALAHDAKDLAKNAIIIGTIGKSPLIDQLIREGKIDATPIAGKWESFFLQVVPQPLPGVESALVIVGSDKRGAIYGIYDLSQQIGVSPWYWWKDVTPRHQDALFAKAGKYTFGEPAVRYRGIFINDEAPDLTNWVIEKYGNYNHQFYGHVFELLLRLRANYLWPAMWNNCFNEDDPANPQLADDYGIVMGTSHVEPMMRADKEWNRKGKGYGPAQWNYATNPEALYNFWVEGILRNKPFENIITVGMRGKIDTPMAANGGMPANIKLLEKIVADQRKIIADKINPDVTKVPQLWALYKEVQGYYDNGMRVPDDITLLWCDDNFGNIRRLPTDAERKRSGGAGVYYHFDYVGGPRNYKWVNTNPIIKVWEQMNLAHHYDANRIWIVNVGHLEDVTYPTEFFLTLGWNPESWPKERIADYGKLWATREFGPEYASDIADIVDKYTKYNGRRKPEVMDPTVYSLVDYQEADQTLSDFKAITTKAEEIWHKLPEDKQAAFFELVLDPTKASEQVMDLYVTAGKNHLYAAQGRASTNDMADQARALFKADQDLSDYYNHTLLNGKWDHMMDQTHIGYTNWQQPPRNQMPDVRELEIPQAAGMGVAIEGSVSAWPRANADAVLPAFDVFNRPARYIDVFDTGKSPFDFSVAVSDPWIVLSKTAGHIDKDQRLWVSIDWTKAPAGDATGTVTITPTGAGDPVTVKLQTTNPTEPNAASLDGFVEGDGYVSMEAEHYSKKIDAGDAHWDKIDDYGRTLSAMSIFPVTAASVLPPANAPCLEYRMYLWKPGNVTINAIVAPTLDFAPGRGLRYAVAFDDQPPQVVNVLAKNALRDWENSVRNNARISGSSHTLSQAGYHTLKIWMVDPALVLEKIVVDTGGLKPSYLGPPESFSHSAAVSAVP